MKAWLPRRLGTQLIAVAVTALIVSQGLITPLVHYLRFQAYTDSIEDETLARVAGVAQILVNTPPELHETVLDSAGSRPFRLWMEAADTPLPSGNATGTALARELITRANGAITAAGVVRDDTGRDGKPMIRVVSRLSDGQVMAARFRLPDFFGRGAETSLKVALAVSLVTATLMWLILRRLTRPLERLSRAADALGQGEPVQALPESGPKDVRETTIAFNRMQHRIQEHINERTRMLASVSHDLRTPITALRLQTEFVSDDDQRQRMQRSLDEMQAVTESALAYLSSGQSNEADKIADVAALIDSVCEDLRLLGRDVEFDYQRGLNLRCRPHQLSRAIRNLVENAVQYGERARISIDRSSDALRIQIDDDGTGIPEEYIDSMLKPFTRMESSRNTHTGGHGLGLAIARDIIAAHGGSLQLVNRDRGGLRQEIRLPT